MTVFSLLLCLPLLTGCANLTDLEAVQEDSREVVALLEPGDRLVQTVAFRRAGLASLTLWANAVPDEPAPSLRVELRFEGSQEPFHSERMVPPPGGPVVLEFPPQAGSAEAVVEVGLEAEEGPVKVWGRVPDDGYANGSASLNNIQLPGDIAFRTGYTYGFASFLEDLKRWLPQGWVLAPLVLVLIAPGFLLLDISGLRQKFEPGEQAGLSVGLSLAIVPLALLWTSTLGLRWTALSVKIAFLVIAGLALWRFTVRFMKPGRPAKAPEATPTSPIHRGRLFYPALLGLVFLLALGVRLVMVRDLATPAWIDSVHHGLITRLILENGAFPPSYLPYVDLPPTQYHAGFHASLAAFLSLAGLDLAEGMLLYGQVLNALAVVAAYLFALTFTHRPLAGVIAGITAGLLMPMPAYLASWGRYPQLAGLLVLPAVFALARQVYHPAEAGKKSWPALLLAVGAAAGLFLVHYRDAAFLATLIAIDGLGWILVARRRGQAEASHPVKAVTATIFALGLGAILLTLPWSWPNLTQLLAPALQASTTMGIKLFSDFSWRFLTAAQGKIALGLSGAGLLLSLAMRKRFAVTVILWLAILFFLANLGALGLPGGWFINSTSVEIMLWLPMGLLAGFGASWLIERLASVLPPRIRLPWILVAALGLAALALVGGVSLVTILNPTTLLSRQGDMPALKWIEANTPPQERILINPFAWGYGLYAGSDGGYWISPLTGRQTLPPPVIYGFGKPEDEAAINAASQKAIDLSSDPPALAAWMETQGLRYLYLGPRGGVFSAQTLLASGLFLERYHQQGAWVLERR